MIQDIRPHVYQSAMMLHPARFQVGVWGRRGGKTTCAKFKAFWKAMNQPGSKIWYVGLTIDAAKNLMWDPLVGNNSDRLIPECLIKHQDNANLKVTLWNGSEISIKGAGNIDNKLGASLDLLILDEFQSMDIKVWNLLRPMLSDRKGEALIIGTPRGYNDFYDLYWKGANDNPNKDPNWQSWKITSIDAALAGTGLDVAEIEGARNDLSPSQFEQEYLASFDAVTGRVYAPFSVTENVIDSWKGEGTDSRFSSEVFHVGMDFNVNPMTAVMAVMPEPGLLYIVDELYLPNSSTPHIISEINSKISLRKNKTVLVYPDASGQNRNTVADNTNHTLLNRAGYGLVVDRSNPRVEDRINEVNAMLLNAAGKRRLFINKRCIHTIKALNSLTYGPDGKPDKKSGFDHITDALGYLVHQRFPINGGGLNSSHF